MFWFVADLIARWRWRWNRSYAAAAKQRQGIRTDLGNFVADLPQSKSRDQAAAAVGASGRAVTQAKAVARDAPDLADKVREGNLMLDVAARACQPSSRSAPFRSSAASRRAPDASKPPGGDSLKQMPAGLRTQRPSSMVSSAAIDTPPMSRVQARTVAPSSVRLSQSGRAPGNVQGGGGADVEGAEVGGHGVRRATTIGSVFGSGARCT